MSGLAPTAPTAIESVGWQGYSDGMNVPTLQFVFRTLGVAAICFALAATGFAHRGFAAPRDAALAQYLAIGGTFSDICGDLGEGQDASGQRCEVCRLVGAAVLPEAAVVLRPLHIRLAADQIGTQCVCAPAAQLDLACPPRAPPSA